MMGKSEDFVRSFNEKCWQDVYRRSLGGLVFIDDFCAECLHWEGGLFNLFEAGAVGVKRMSPFETGNERQKKAVFVTRGTLFCLDTIREILLRGHFVSCVVVLTADSNILPSELNVTFDNLERDIEEWIGNKPCSIEIVHIPIFSISLSNNVFITPPFGELYPRFGENFIPTDISALDLHSLDPEEKNQVRRLAASFHSLFEFMDVKEDIFFMGPFSSIIAGVLEHLPEAVNRRKKATKSASVIFLDRTVDLCAVTTHASDSLLDKMMNVLPRFPGHSVDLAVNVSALTSAEMVKVDDDIHLCPGCVVHKGDGDCEQIFDHLMNKSQNEAMFGLYNKLTKISETSPGKFPPRITPQNLEKLTSAYRGNYDKIEPNAGILQQSLGVIQTLKSPDIQQLELLMCLEKQVLQSITTSRDSTSVLSQISLIVRSWKQRGLSMNRILALLVHIYSLASGYIVFSEAQEKTLHDSLSVALFEERSERKNGETLFTPEEASTAATMIIGRLREIAKIRDPLVKYKSVIKTIDKVSPSEYNGILQQMICDMVDVKRPDMPDLKCRSSGLKDLLKSGLSMLMSTTAKNAQSAAKHPFDNPTVVVFIVGGTTADECSQIHRNVMISGTDTDVVVGSTALMNPVEATKKVLRL